MNRATMAKLAARSRSLPLFELLGRRPALVVLVYHRVMPHEQHPYDRALIEATPEQFDEQMAMLKKRHAVADPEELLSLVENPKSVRSLRVAITFDDGYRDNYRFAFPILKSHGLAAAFYLPTQYIGTRTLPWWDQVANAIRRCTKDEIDLRYPKAFKVRVNRDDPEVAIQSVLRAYGRDPSAVLARFLEEVERACELELVEESEEPQFMSWDEAAEMNRAGMAIESHTRSHQVLANLTSEEQRGECFESRALLRARGLSAISLAYPVGHKTAFTPETVALAREAGYRYAVSNYGGINLPETMNRFDVRRLGMDAAVSATQLRLRFALTGLARQAPW
ncbi:MAG: polysaccharide deacetylase family protein [Polyangiaceae bacterium]